MTKLTNTLKSAIHPSFLRERNKRLFKALYGHTDLDVHSFAPPANNGRTRPSRNPSLTPKPPSCKSKSFQSSYFNRPAKLWNYVCKILPSTTFASLSIFKISLKATYANLVTATVDVDMPCTWTLVTDLK
jgi:hypothetical protein